MLPSNLFIDGKKFTSIVLTYISLVMMQQIWKIWSILCTYLVHFHWPSHIYAHIGGRFRGFHWFPWNLLFQSDHYSATSMHCLMTVFKIYFVLLHNQSRALITTKCKQFSLSWMIFNQSCITINGEHQLEHQANELQD